MANVISAIRDPLESLFFSGKKRNGTLPIVG
jgi:hypothetical protein